MSPEKKIDVLKEYEEIITNIIVMDDVKERGKEISKLTKLVCGLMNEVA